MEIVHNNQKKNEENVAFSVSYGSKPAETVLENMEKSLLNQMGNVFSQPLPGHVRLSAGCRSDRFFPLDAHSISGRNRSCAEIL